MVRLRINNFSTVTRAFGKRDFLKEMEFKSFPRILTREPLKKVEKTEKELWYLKMAPYSKDSSKKTKSMGSEKWPSKITVGKGFGETDI